MIVLVFLVAFCCIYAACTCGSLPPSATFRDSTTFCDLPWLNHLLRPSVTLLPFATLLPSASGHIQDLGLAWWWLCNGSTVDLNRTCLLRLTTIQLLTLVCLTTCLCCLYPPYLWLIHHVYIAYILHRLIYIWVRLFDSYKPGLHTVL